MIRMILFTLLFMLTACGTTAKSPIEANSARGSGAVIL